MADDMIQLQHNPFWIKKIRTAFATYDTNRDRVVTIDDFKLTAERFGEKCPRRANEIMSSYIKLWNESTDGPDTKLNEKEFIDVCIKINAWSNAKELFKMNIDTRFHLIDQNEDGVISVKEFTDYFECMGLNPSDAPASFKALDTNGDGVISKEEFSDAALEFRFGATEGHPSYLFYGPLVD